MYSLVSLLYSKHRAKSFHILLIKKAGASRQNIALQMFFTLNLSYISLNVLWFSRSACYNATRVLSAVFLCCLKHLCVSFLFANLYPGVNITLLPQRFKFIDFHPMQTFRYLVCA